MGKKILIIRLGSLGDIILSSAAVTNIKIKHPDSHLVYLCKERFRRAVELIDGVDEIVTLPESISVFGYYKTLLALDGKNFNIVLDLHGNLRSWLARKTITADQTIVYPKRRFDRLIAVKRKIIPQIWPHTIDLYNDAVEEAGADTYCHRPRLIDRGVGLADNVRGFLDRHQRFVLMAPGAAHSNKQWPIERFAEVATYLNRQKQVGIIWAITSVDDNKGSPEAEIGADHFLQVVDLPIPQLASVISRASVVVANDSGVAHLSSAVGTPVIALFGPTHPALGFAPRGLFDRVIEVDEPCRPCSLHGKKECYRDQRYCFERISSQTVSEAAAEVLQKRKNQSAAIFIDRDGTIIADKNFLSDPDQVEFIEGSVEGLRILKKAGFKVVIISNQSGVARGYFDIETVERVNRRLMGMLAAQHVEVDGIFYCPHHPAGSVELYTQKCECRKPAAGMAEDAAYQLGLDLRKSYVIGDKIDDINLAAVIGARAFMVMTGYGQKQHSVLAEGAFYDKVAVAADLLAAAREITSMGDNG